MLRSVSVTLAAGNLYARVLASLANKAIVKRAIHVSTPKALCSVNDQNLPASNHLIPADKLFAHDTDILLEQLKKASNVDRILELVSMHVDVMNDRHVVATFEMIHDIVKTIKGTDDETLDLKHNAAFQSLCNRALKRARFLDGQQVISIYKTLSRVGVHGNTYVVQAMLKMLCSHVNDLNINELIFLNFLLVRQRPSPMIDGLKMALPLVLQVQIDHQLDSENLNDVVDCLKISCKARLKPASIEKVLNAVRKRASALTPLHASTIIFSLFSLATPVDGYSQLLKGAFEVVSCNIEQPSRDTLMQMTRVCVKELFYYRTFLMKLGQRAYTEKWELKDCYLLSTYFRKLNFYSPELTELLSEQICSEPNIIRRVASYSPLILAELFSFTSHQVPKLRDTFDVLSSCEEKLNALYERTPHLFVKFASCLVSQGYFSEPLLKKIMNENFLFDAWSFSKKNGRLADFECFLCCLQWAFDVYDQGDKFEIPLSVMKRVIQSMQQRQIQSFDHPLTKFLENGLGGNQFFHSGVSTRNGHIIDHVLAMRNGNYPVSLQSPNISLNDFKFIEDIQVPDDSKIITVVVANKKHYCSDPELLKGWMDLKIRHLSKMSYSPIVINYENWILLPDREKVPFLMKEIKQAIQAESVTNTNALLF